MSVLLHCFVKDILFRSFPSALPPSPWSYPVVGILHKVVLLCNSSSAQLPSLLAYSVVGLGDMNARLGKNINDLTKDVPGFS